MADDTDELDYDVIVVRFDRERGRTIVDLGGVDLFSALTMLSLAVEGVSEELDPAIVTFDGDIVTDEEEAEDE